MAASEGRPGKRSVGQVYRCFLVRCRLEEGTGPNREPGWRLTIQRVSPESARRSFASLKDLEIYLEGELTAAEGDAAESKEVTLKSEECAAKGTR